MSPQSCASYLFVSFWAPPLPHLSLSPSSFAVFDSYAFPFVLYWHHVSVYLAGLSCIMWRRHWRPTPVLLPGKSHGRRSLVGCSPWGREESNATEPLPFHFSLSCIGEGNGNPLQCSCLENPRDGGAWWAAVYGVAQSRTRLKRLGSLAGLQLGRLLCPWNSPVKNTGVGCYFLLQGIFLTQGSNLISPSQIIYQLGHQGNPASSLNLL